MKTRLSFFLSCPVLSGKTWIHKPDTGNIRFTCLRRDTPSLVFFACWLPEVKYEVRYCQAKLSCQGARGLCFGRDGPVVGYSTIQYGVRSTFCCNTRGSEAKFSGCKSQSSKSGWIVRERMDESGKTDKSD